MFIDFREGKRKEEQERERERERNIHVRNIHWFFPISAPAMDQTCNLDMCPDWHSNLQLFGVQDNDPTN